MIIVANPVENLLSRLDRVRQTGPDRWIARCPGPNHAHGDRHPSLNISEKPDGRVLIKCFSCETPAILAALGLEFSDLYPPRPATDTYLAPDRRPPIPALDILRSLAFETTIVLCAAADMLNAGDLVLGPEGFARLSQAHDRIQSTLTYAEGVRRYG